MAITNSVNFRLWVNEKAKIRGQVLSDIYGLLNVRADADEVVKIALAESWTGKEMVEYLGSGSGAASVSVQKPGAAIPMPPPATAIPVPPPVPTASPAPRTGGKPTRADALRMKRGGPAQVIEAVPSEQPAVKKGDRSHPKVDDQEPKPAKEGFFKSWPKKGDPAKVHTEPAEKPAGAKKKGLIIAIIVIVVVLLVGGGIAYFSISDSTWCSTYPAAFCRTKPLARVPVTECEEQRRAWRFLGQACHERSKQSELSLQALSNAMAVMDHTNRYALDATEARPFGGRRGDRR